MLQQITIEYNTSKATQQKTTLLFIMLYKIYQLCIALPIIFVATVITALVTIIGGLFNAHVFGYYPGKIWSRLICRVLLLPIKVEGRENIDHNQKLCVCGQPPGTNGHIPYIWLSEPQL